MNESKSTKSYIQNWFIANKKKRKPRTLSRSCVCVCGFPCGVCVCVRCKQSQKVLLRLFLDDVVAPHDVAINTMDEYTEQAHLYLGSQKKHHWYKVRRYSFGFPSHNSQFTTNWKSFGSKRTIKKKVMLMNTTKTINNQCLCVCVCKRK